MGGATFTDMSTAWVNPEVEKWRWRSCVNHVIADVAFVNVHIVGLSWKVGVTDINAEVIQQFIDAQGWKGRAIWDYHGDKWRNGYRQRNGICLRMRDGANGLMEHTGAGGVWILWEWSQVCDWLMKGWPTTDRQDMADDCSPLGTWCCIEQRQGPLAHIVRGPFGWDRAMKQMRRLGIPKEVRELKRKMTDAEAVEALCSAVKQHRTKLDEIHI